MVLYVSTWHFTFVLPAVAVVVISLVHPCTSHIAFKSYDWTCMNILFVKPSLVSINTYSDLQRIYLTWKAPADAPEFSPCLSDPFWWLCTGWQKTPPTLAVATCRWCWPPAGWCRPASSGCTQSPPAPGLCSDWTAYRWVLICLCASWAQFLRRWLSSSWSCAATLAQRLARRTPHCPWIAHQTGGPRGWNGEQDRKKKRAKCQCLEKCLTSVKYRFIWLPPRTADEHLQVRCGTLTPSQLNPASVCSQPGTELRTEQSAWNIWLQGSNSVHLDMETWPEQSAGVHSQWRQRGVEVTFNWVIFMASMPNLWVQVGEQSCVKDLFLFVCFLNILMLCTVSDTTNNN